MVRSVFNTGLALACAIGLVVPRAAAQSPETLFASTVETVDGWNFETQAEGQPGDPGCNSTPEPYAVQPDSSFSLNWLVASNFQTFSLPAGTMVTRVEMGVLCRFDMNLQGQFDLSALVDGTWRNVVNDQNTTTNNGDCDWFVYDVTDHWSSLGIDLTCSSQARINAFQMRVRRTNDTGGSGNFRVKAFRMRVWYENDSDGDCEPASTDCADGNASIHHGATEVCNGLDDDCDGLADDGLSTQTWHRDQDQDGYGDPATSMSSCSQPAGYVLDGTDCADASSSIHPGAAEVCNGIDDDCDHVADDGLTFLTYYADADHDGFGMTSNSLTSCSAPTGYVLVAGDCNDSDSAIHPGATEICNHIDDDCDGVIDDGVPTQTWYRDQDQDGYGDPAASLSSCSQPPGYVLDGTDCDDASNSVHPGAPEVCNGIDDDCDGTIDGGICMPIAPYCFGDGTGFPCPCGNSGTAGHGCANSINVQGALLDAVGTPHLTADDVVLQGWGMPSSSNPSAIFLQGTGQDSNGLGTPVQDGLRCVVGNIIRLRTKVNVGGASHFPDTGDPTLSDRGGVTVPGTRYYQVFYRNASAAYCPPGTANWTNGLAITWSP